MSLPAPTQMPLCNPISQSSEPQAVAPGSLSWPLTHNAIGALADAVQLLKLLHAPALSQLKERCCQHRNLEANATTEDGYFMCAWY
jgi:hypothetical protein